MLLAHAGVADGWRNRLWMMTAKATHPALLVATIGVKPAGTACFVLK